MVKPAITTPKKNIFNKDILEQGTLSFSVGGLFDTAKVSSPQRVRVSDLIPVKPNTSYTISVPTTHYAGIQTFSYDRKAISDTGWVNGTFTKLTESNACYVALNTRKTDSSNVTVSEMQSLLIQLEEGSTATQFEPYIPLNKPAYGNKPANTTPKKNYFDKNKVTSGYSLNGGGAVIVNNSFAYSDYIEIKPSTNYIKTTANFSEYYDFNKNVVSGASNTNFTTPANAKYIRINIPLSSIDSYQLEEGSVATTYEPYIPQNKPAYIPPQTVTLTLDYAGKIAGSTAENPNIIKPNVTGGETTLLTPSQFTAEINQSKYNATKNLDGSLYVQSTLLVNGAIGQTIFGFDIISGLERSLGSSIWQGQTSLAQKIVIAKNMIQGSITTEWYGFGSGVGGNKATFTPWVNGSNWGTGLNHTSNSVTKILNYVSAVHINSDGFVYCLAYANSSDGVTSSVINTDYISLTVNINNPFAGNKPAL